MFSDLNNDMISNIVKSNPAFEAILQKVCEENKQTTSMFVHELRNPLSLLKGTIQYIEVKHPEVKEFKYWDQMQDLVNDMEHMMADASILNTCNSLNKDTVNLVEFLTSIKNSFMPRAISQQVDLHLSIDNGCERYFQSYQCDPARMKQVFTNLIKNALEATTSGNYIHIHMCCLSDGATSPKLMIQINNNGLPIPEYEIDNIFLPFVTYKKGGTGVGLAITKKIIDMHYGHIQVTSSSVITSFTILLPFN